MTGPNLNYPCYLFLFIVIIAVPTLHNMLLSAYSRI